MVCLRAAGFPAAAVNPYMAGFGPAAMNPFLAMGRGPFDPLMAWYMAHYGSTGLMPGLGFTTGRQVPASSLCSGHASVPVSLTAAGSELSITRLCCCTQ